MSARIDVVGAWVVVVMTTAMSLVTSLTRTLDPLM